MVCLCVDEPLGLEFLAVRAPVHCCQSEVMYQYHLQSYTLATAKSVFGDHDGIDEELYGRLRCTP